MHIDDRSLNLLGALALALSDAIRNAAVETSGRSLSDAAALAVVHGSPGGSIDTLAKTLGLTPAGASRLVARLEAAGLVRSEPGSKDARLRGLVLTKTGDHAASNVLSARRVAIARAAAALSPDDQGHLARLLETMLAAMTPDRWTAEHSCRLCDLDACPPNDCPVELAARRSER